MVRSDQAFQTTTFLGVDYVYYHGSEGHVTFGVLYIKYMLNQLDSTLY